MQRAEALAKIDIIARKRELALDDLNEHTEFRIKKYLTQSYYEEANLKKFLRENPEL